MPLTEADLDTGICKHCNRTLREHCTAADGAWYFSPCRWHLLTLAPADWREQINEHGLCLDCSRSAESHFQLWTPQASIQFGSARAEIMAVGVVIARIPSGFTDCRT